MFPDAGAGKEVAGVAGAAPTQQGTDVVAGTGASAPPPALAALLPGVRALCFDLDGTLLDTIPDLAAAANGMMRDLGLAPLDQTLISTFVGKGADRLIERMLSAGGRPVLPDSAAFGEARERFHDNYRQCNGQAAALYPGVTSGLARIRALGLPMACVTNKPQEHIRPLLERFGMLDDFAFSIGGDTLPVRKPHPGQLLEACRRWQLQPHQVLMVGDSLNDAEAARAAGMPVVMLPYGYNEGHALDSVDVDAIIATIDVLAGWLESARSESQEKGV